VFVGKSVVGPGGRGGGVHKGTIVARGMTGCAGSAGPAVEP
jgi:hypothetical protein